MHMQLGRRPLGRFLGVSPAGQDTEIKIAVHIWALMQLFNTSRSGDLRVSSSPDDLRLRYRERIRSLLARNRSLRRDIPEV